MRTSNITPRRSDSEDQKNPVSAQGSNMLNRPYAG